MGAHITYAPREAIKSQVLPDFVVEWTEARLPPKPVDEEYWVMHFDGSVKRTGAGVGLVFTSPRNVRIRYLIRLHFPTSNNAAEYEALVSGLRIALELGILQLEVRGDSELITSQVMKEADCHNPKMAAYCRDVRKLEEKFHGLELNHIPRQHRPMSCPK